ncbi:sugar ABC transporter permease, partial [Schumannella luteola]
MTTGDLIGKILQLVIGLVIFAAIVGLLVFFIDKAPKKGRDYWQLVGFLAPALILLTIGLVYPA